MKGIYMNIIHRIRKGGFLKKGINWVYEKEKTNVGIHRHIMLSIVTKTKIISIGSKYTSFFPESLERAKSYKNY